MDSVNSSKKFNNIQLVSLLHVTTTLQLESRVKVGKQDPENTNQMGIQNCWCVAKKLRRRRDTKAANSEYRMINRVSVQQEKRGLVAVEPHVNDF